MMDDNTYQGGLLSVKSVGAQGSREEKEVGFPNEAVLENNGEVSVIREPIEVSDFEIADIIEAKLSGFMRVSGNHWYITCEHGWKRDADKQIYAFVKSAIRALTDETKYYSSQRMRSVITALEGCQGLRVPVSEWDSDQAILNTPVGIVDLKTGKIRVLEEDDFVTKVSGVAPIQGSTPLFDQFLRETFPVECWGNAQEEVIDFVLGVLSLAVTGEQLVQQFFFLWGSGANGKSVLLDIMRDLLGDYGITLKTSALMSGNQNGKDYEIARLDGVRMAVASELGRTDRWDEPLVKSLTGDSTIPIRQIYGTPKEAVNQATLIIAGNHKPRFNGTDGGMVRRMVMLPFKAVVPKEQRDVNLRSKIVAAEGGAILDKLIQRLVRLRSEGLNQPEVIQAATDDYVLQNDDLQAFFDDHCDRAEGSWASTDDLYRIFRVWKENRGERPMAQSQWAPEFMDKFGLKKTRKGKQKITVFLGIKLKDSTLLR
jgi:P4 family phage/plasmid primase-like protien